MTTNSAPTSHGRFARPQNARWQRIRESITLRRILVSLVLALAVGVPLAFTVKEDTAPPVPLDAAVATVFPDPENLQLRQSDIGIQLRNTYQFVGLAIDKYPIPEDQLSVVTALNQYTFTAGPDKDITEFTPGRHCASATFKPLNGTDDQIRTKTWCFEFH